VILRCTKYIFSPSRRFHCTVDDDDDATCARDKEKNERNLIFFRERARSAKMEKW